MHLVANSSRQVGDGTRGERTFEGGHEGEVGGIWVACQQGAEKQVPGLGDITFSLASFGQEGGVLTAKVSFANPGGFCIQTGRLGRPQAVREGIIYPLRVDEEFFVFPAVRPDYFSCISFDQATRAELQNGRKI